MRKTYKSVLAAGTLVAVSIAIPAMTSAFSKSRLEGKERLGSKHAVTMTEKKSRATVEANGTPYWHTVKSIYNSEGKTDLENGVVREYGTRVEIDGETAKIYGLVNFWFNEVDQEYVIEGTYNARYGTITVSGTGYDPEKSVDDYVKVAEIYSPYDETDYTLVLIAGNCKYDGSVATEEELVFNVSSDLSTITSKTGFGAYAFDSQGQPAAFYDYYQTSSMTKAAEEVNLSASIDRLAFPNQFVATGMPIKEQFNLLNRGALDCEFTVTTSSPCISVTPVEGTLEGCSTKALMVTFSPDEAGIFNGTVSISGGGDSVEIPVEVDVKEKPDYTKIVKAGSDPMEFSMSSLYPFVISEVDGHTVAESTNNGKGDNTESWFSCIIDVPTGKSGVFSWNAAMECQQPNGLVVILDGEWVKYEMERPNTDPYDMSGAIALTQGRHEISFVNNISKDWSVYDVFQRSYVWDLDLKLIDSKDDNAVVVNNSVDFGETYFDSLSVRMNSEVSVLNVGKNPLRINSITGEGNFSGVVPDISVPTGGEIIVPLTWDATATGTDEGTVTIHTTGGDLEVNCIGLATALPYDYSGIVKEGDISFNTGIDWPFIMDENIPYAYNSTSKQDINGITFSWIEASFEVPEGNVGQISWDALNDSEDPFEFMGIPSIISGTFITLDGMNEKAIGGVGTHCASSDLYTDIDLKFRPGKHTVRFSYKKTDNSDNYVFGEDRLKLYEIALKLNNAEDGKGQLSESSVNYPDKIFVGISGHAYVTLHNFTDETPEFLSSECDGPFKAEKVSEEDGDIEFMILFTPETEGEYADILTVKTTIGDYTIDCSGSAEMSGLGKALYYESFEYDFNNGWIFKDMTDCGHNWIITKTLFESFKNNGLAPYDGKGYMFISFMNPEEFQYYDNTDAYASTPEIRIPEDGKTTLRFMLKGVNYDMQMLDVFAGEGDDPEMYKVLGTVNLTPNDADWTSYTFDLSEFAGKTIRIAFHSGDEVGTFFALDDILVASTGATSVGTIGTEVMGNIEYYTPDGLRHERPVKGMNIVVIRNEDGSVVTRKMKMD